VDVSEPAGQTAQPSDPKRQRRTIAGRTVFLSDEGFLWNFQDWSEELAETLARESGLESLGATQWKVIRFMREFYANNGRAPLNRQLREGTGLSLLELEGLFPRGIKYGARRIAGLPGGSSMGCN
jgi:dissimilatory sulfite reductase related protein